jgi:plastocyanin
MWSGSADGMDAMDMQPTATSTEATTQIAPRTRGELAAAPVPPLPAKSASSAELNGCMTLLGDGRVMLKALGSSRTYRLEAQPFLFSQNANRVVHVTGRFGSVVEMEDPNIPSFVVDTLDAVAPNCSTRMTTADVRKVLDKRDMASRTVVSMGEMSFQPATLTIDAGETVVWKNASNVTHNVVDDASKALYMVDVKLPSGTKPFDSGYVQPYQAFSRVFAIPGVYRYVCTLHEASGMKGTIIVRPRATEVASGGSGNKAGE